MFLKEAIDKLGVDVNIFRAGTFKSFTDQFSRSDMAPSEREESSVWLEALWNAYQQDVTRARSLPANALERVRGARSPRRWPPSTATPPSSRCSAAWSPR